MTTNSLSSPSAAAIARPMPREAPVTNATRWLPICQRSQLDRRRDPLEQSREHRAWADFVRLVDAARLEVLDRLFPTHRSGHLAVQQLFDPRRVAVRLRGHVGDH